MGSAVPAPATTAAALLGPEALADVARAPLGAYLHVPFCAARCGYCDFTTYTASELPGGGHRAGWADAARAELALAARELGDDHPPVSTVFFGGGTPTLLPPEDLIAALRGVEEHLGLAPGAEVTTEANPESVDPASLAALRAGGFTRLSLGMQSAAPGVLATLDRVHTPGRAVAAVGEARAAGFEHISLDLIFGTPGESAEDWERTLDAALEAEPDHVSAYGLIVEPGTAMAAQVRRGLLPAPDPDEQADRYLAAAERLEAAGLRWYEVANFSRTEAARCHHNINYWRSGTWWGVGPGAHSHAGGVRWSNVRHPTAWAKAIAAGEVPLADREELDGPTRRFERIMLGVRLAEGLDARELSREGRRAAVRLRDDGVVTLEDDDRVRLTLRGRLVADAVTRELTD